MPEAYTSSSGRIRRASDQIEPDSFVANPRGRGEKRRGEMTALRDSRVKRRDGYTAASRESTRRESMKDK